MQNYNQIEKKLHKLILGTNLIQKSLFEIENFFFLNKDHDISNNKHIFISGLPRSGTTMLLNILYKSNIFASLTYADMPFVMAPNLYKKFQTKKKLVPKERLHKDGIFYDLNSPESFDEIFFNTFKKSEYPINLKNYISLILLKYKKNRYLSKNNNNFKRIKTINSIFPKSQIIISFRDPLQHASSLLDQHQNFCSLQKKDKFILDYMNFLGHNEFGLNYINWYLPIQYKDKLSLNHWLEQWFLFYENILDNIESYKNINLFCYDDIFKNEELINKIENRFNIDKIDRKLIKNVSKKYININYDYKILSKCIKIFDKLKEISTLKN